MRPIFPQPGHTEQDLHDLLQGRRFIYVDCFTIRAKDGSVLRYSTAQRDVRVIPVDDPDAVLPVTYTSNQVKVSGLKTVIGIGVEVDEQDLQLDYSPSQEYMGQPFSAAIRRGRLDGAIIRRDRYFARKWGTGWIAGTPMFVGRMSSVDRVGRSAATIKVKSHLVLLNMNMPRKLFQPQCNWTLFDPGCGLDRDDYTQLGQIDAQSTSSMVYVSGIQGIENFKYGVMQIQDGDAFTEIRTIKNVGGNFFELSYPLDFVPSAGTPFSCYPGCIRTYERCGDYNNRHRFQAFEFVPQAETAY